jgi:hypothetical protein
MIIIMNKFIISITVVFLLVVILCLKITLVEYFSNSCERIDKSLKKLKDNYSIKIDINDVKKQCKTEYNEACNDSSLNRVLKELTNNSISPTNIPNLTNMPDTLDNLYKCILDNGLMDMDLDMDTLKIDT